MAPQVLLALLQPTGKGWAPEPETQPGRTGNPLGSSRAKESLSSCRTMAEGQPRQLPTHRSERESPAGWAGARLRGWTLPGHWLQLSGAPGSSVA
ncbi:hypothetical protein PAL_GLEAN10012688 [Pteropus alecto]|uniref:Uncharacterized protein n=1 Tax=Pteropus alecto TaxID=9402 RepID=L5KA86_PTEAL|nr:hypothetical protein PAL_GLEAN10012688 [Pteropus alecto]